MISQIEKAESSDIEIVSSILQGNIRSYETIIRRYSSCLYKIGSSFSFNHEDTEDVIQEVFTSAFLSLGQFQGRSTFKTWLVQIMLHQCYHKKKKMNKNQQCAAEGCLTSNNMLALPSRRPTPDKQTQTRELNEILKFAIHHLPRAYQDVFILRIQKKLSVSETARQLSISEENVKVKLHRARHLLQQEITRFYSLNDIQSHIA